MFCRESIVQTFLGEKNKVKKCLIFFFFSLTLRCENVNEPHKDVLKKCEKFMFMLEPVFLWQMYFSKLYTGNYLFVL